MFYGTRTLNKKNWEFAGFHLRYF